MCDKCGCSNNNYHHHHNQDHHHHPKQYVDQHAHKHDHKHDYLGVNVYKSLLSANDHQAHENRQHFKALGTVAINLISSPGSGKTALLEKTIELLGNKLNIGVIEGDIETEKDAQRIRAKGAPAVQLTTGGACHLDARLVHKGIHELEHVAGNKKLDLIFIENVGNLVCPASFDLGEHVRVVLVSVPEGSDKPAKYPTAFTGSQLFIVTKTDLLPYFDFEMEEAIKEAKRINPTIETLTLSSKTGEGMDNWLLFLDKTIKKHKK